MAATGAVNSGRNSLNSLIGMSPGTLQVFLALLNPSYTIWSARSCYWADFDQTLKIGYLDHLKQILTVTVTFVQATFGLVTFVHIRNISAVTDPILTKL